MADQPDPEDEAEHEHLDELVDLQSRGSFPASDPPSTWAGPEEKTHHGG